MTVAAAYPSGIELADLLRDTRHLAARAAPELAAAALARLNTKEGT